MKLPTSAPLFEMLTTRLDVLSTRQASIAANVANSTTPGYVPKDVDMEKFGAVMERVQKGDTAMAGPMMTHAHHLAGTRAQTPAGSLVRTTPDSETTLDGNAVVIEEQMLKMNQTRSDFETAISLYKKGLDMIKLASRGPI